MFINKNSIKINGVSIGQYITTAEYGYNKLWGSDSGRNMAGTQSGTFLGVYPKIIVNFRKLTKSELELLAPYLDAPYQTITYYDPNKRSEVSMATYSGDYSIINKGIIGNHKNEPFQISFISVSRRT